MKWFVQLRQLKQTIPFHSRVRAVTMHNCYMFSHIGSSIKRYIFVSKEIKADMDILHAEHNVVWAFVDMGEMRMLHREGLFHKNHEAKAKIEKNKNRTVWVTWPVLTHQSKNDSFYYTNQTIELNWLTCFIVCDMKENDTRSMVNMTQICANA